MTFRASNQCVIEWLSDSVLTVIGRDAESLIGVPFAELVHPDDLDTLRAAERTVLGGSPARFDARIGVLAGWRWMSIIVQPVFGDDGTVIGCAGGWRDVDRERRDAAAQDALHRRFRLLAERTGDVMCSFTCDGILEWVSPSVQHVLGFDPAHVIGSRPDWLHPADRERVETLVGDAVRHGERRVASRCRLLASDLRILWADVEVQIDRNADGSIRSLCAVLHDVTDLVQREAALRLLEAETAQLLRRRESVLASLVDPTVVLEAVRSSTGSIVDFHYALASASAIDYFGLPFDLLAGTTMLVSFRDQRTSGLFDACVSAVESQEVVRWVAHPMPRARTGTLRLYDVTMVPAGDDVAVTWSDVTENVVRQRDRDEALALHRSLFESAPVGIIALRPDGSVAASNPVAERLLGLTGDQLRGVAPVPAAWRCEREDGTESSLDELAAGPVREAGVAVRGRVLRVVHAAGERTMLVADASPIGEWSELDPCGVVVTLSPRAGEDAAVVAG